MLQNLAAIFSLQALLDLSFFGTTYQLASANLPLVMFNSTWNIRAVDYYPVQIHSPLRPDHWLRLVPFRHTSDHLSPLIPNCQFRNYLRLYRLDRHWTRELHRNPNILHAHSNGTRNRNRQLDPTPVLITLHDRYDKISTPASSPSQPS